MIVCHLNASNSIHSRPVNDFKSGAPRLPLRQVRRWFAVWMRGLCCVRTLHAKCLRVCSTLARRCCCYVGPDRMTSFARSVNNEDQTPHALHYKTKSGVCTGFFPFKEKQSSPGLKQLADLYKKNTPRCVIAVVEGRNTVVVACGTYLASCAVLLADRERRRQTSRNKMFI